MSFYEKNIASIFEVDAVLASRIFAFSENKKYDVFVDKDDAIDINIYDQERGEFLYEKKPVEEVLEQYEKLYKNFARHPFVWFYGISNGLLIKMFLNTGKTIFLFEEELELLYIAMNFFDFSNEIQEKRLRIYWTKKSGFNEISRICSDMEVKAFLKTYSLEVTNEYYMRHYYQGIKNINDIFIQAIGTTIAQEGNDAQDSLIGLDHHLKHIPQMLNSYRLTDFLEKINTQSAVIVSTGPSLAKQLPLLKKYQNYLTILCIDASLPILQAEKIRPDFVFSLERVEATAKFYENIDKDVCKDTIFMPTSIVHPKTLKNIGDMKKAITMRPFGYTFAFKMDKWAYIGRGMSAANMAFDFAFLAEFKNIVFIGQDLALASDGRTHSKGAIYGENEKSYQKGTSLIKGYYGGKVKTSNAWKLFLATFIRDIVDVKEKGISVYNCTEGGAYIEGAEHIAFKEFLESIEQKKKEVIYTQVVSESTQLHYLKRTKKLIELYIQRLTYIQGEIETVFLEVMKEIDILETLNRDEDLEKIDFDRLIQVISHIDDIKDIYENDRVLMKFGNITNPFIVNAELELATIMVRVSDDEMEKKVKMVDWIYAHKSWLFFLAGAIENILFILKENYEEVYKSIK